MLNIGVPVEETTVICPGCGVRLLSTNTDLEDQLNASRACRDLYHNLTYYTLSLGDFYFIHQLAVDAYTAQHFGENVKAIGITFALVGLYLVNERGYTGRQVQRAHMALTKKSKDWPSFASRLGKATLTVQDVVQAPDEKKQEMLKRWHASVWEIWKSEQGTIAALLKKHLDIA